jgi:hypothetical protein
MYWENTLHFTYKIKLFSPQLKTFNTDPVGNCKRILPFLFWQITSSHLANYYITEIISFIFSPRSISQSTPVDRHTKYPESFRYFPQFLHANSRINTIIEPKSYSFKFLIHQSFYYWRLYSLITSSVTKCIRNAIPIQTSKKTGAESSFR